MLGLHRRGNRLSRLTTGRSTEGPASVLLGLLAILAVAVEYQILVSIWSGHEHPVLQFLYVGLPLLAVILAAAALSLGREGMERKDRNSIFGVIGLFISVLAFVACAALFGVACAASGGFLTVWRFVQR